MTDGSTQETEDIMLTTVDNPYNPFTRFKEWLTWDTDAGYNSVSFLARIAKSSYELSEADQSQAIADAIDEICRENVSGVHRKVSRSSAVELGLL
jgi:hypothetical protein